MDNGTAGAPGSTASVDPAALDAIFAPYDQGHLPGVAVGVALGGVPAYRKGFGLASLELPVTLSPTIRMRIGSTTKHFGALAFMLLAEEGRASPDDPVRKYLPELPPRFDRITMRQLMTHVSGLRCSLELVLQLSGPGHFVSTEDQVRLTAEDDGVNFEPNAEWSYNNGGYVLLTAVIERITGRDLGPFLEERVFRPVGMHDTMLRLLDTDFVPNSASLHMMDGKGGFYRQPMGPEIAAEGGIVSTVDDMLRWLRHMADPIVGTPATWREMTRTAVLDNGYDTGYGLGLLSGEYRGVRVVHHAGGLFGGACQMLRVPDHGLDIVILTNRAGVDPMGLANKVIDACVPGLGPAVEPFAGPVPTGTYYSPRTGASFTLGRHGDMATISLSGSTLPLAKFPDGSFRPTIPVFHTRLFLPETAEPQATIRGVEFGQEETLHLLTPDPAADLAPLAGRYEARASGTTALVEVTPEGGRLTFRGRYGTVVHRLSNAAPGLWNASVTSLPVPMLTGIVAFDGDGGGFTFTSGRTRRLRFGRAA